jgi:hypothetical protein
VAANWPESEVGHLHPYSAETRSVLREVMLKDMDSLVKGPDNTEILALVPILCRQILVSPFMDILYECAFFWTASVV